MRSETESATVTGGGMPGKSGGDTAGVVRRLRPVRVVALLCLLALAAVAFLLWADSYVGNYGSTRIYENVEEVPAASAALVLGTAKFSVAGGQNLYYMPRIKAAADLYKSGKVRGIVVSGDNATQAYNEPQRMKEDLGKLGVPLEHITCDYAGFRTLDSVVRMQTIFGMEDFIIVSQRFHVERALFLARSHGSRIEGFAAADVPEGYGVKVRLREVLARAKAVLDVHLFKTEPKFLGDPVEVGLKALE